MDDLNFELDDLEIGDIAVTSMRDAVALPETGASWSVSCAESCSCCSICFEQDS